MFVFLDIGFTLIGGPKVGPAGRLIQRFGLPSTAKPLLNEWLFKTQLSGSEELGDHLVGNYGVNKEQAYRFAHELWTEQSGEAYVLPGAVEALKRLRGSGIPYGFISNIWAPFLDGFSRLFPTDSKECLTLASFQRGMVKPDTGLYLAALREADVDPLSAVMVGDSYETDMVPAKQLGMKTVWILHRPDKERPYIVDVLNKRAPTPDLTLSNIGNLNTECLRALFDR